jgi:putative flippase GtrA
MASLVSRALAFRRTAHFKRLWKYASVSIISTLVTQVVLFLTYHVLSWGSAMECNVIATVVASVPAYYLNRSWTWGKKGRSNIWGEVVPFWSIALIAMVLSTVAVGVAAHNADRITHGSLERALLVNGANLVTYAVLWTARYFVLNRFLFGSRTVESAAAQEEEDAGLEVSSAVMGGEDVGLASGVSELAATDRVDPAV